MSLETDSVSVILAVQHLRNSAPALVARFVVKSVVDSVVAEDPVHMEAWEPDVPLLHQVCAVQQLCGRQGQYGKGTDPGL